MYCKVELVEYHHRNIVVQNTQPLKFEISFRYFQLISYHLLNVSLDSY